MGLNHLDFDDEEKTDSWSNFLATINVSPLPFGEGQETVLLRRAMNALRRSPNREDVDVPVAISHMPCCGMERQDRTSSQAGTVWHLSNKGGKIIHKECGTELQFN